VAATDAMKTALKPATSASTPAQSGAANALPEQLDQLVLHLPRLTPIPAEAIAGGRVRALAKTMRAAAHR
jgi:hypothetical protein